MKVVKKRRKRNPDPKTVGRFGVCDNCKTKVQIEKYDQGQLYARSGYELVWFDCPVCNEQQGIEIVLKKPKTRFGR
jgi:hypothetical protein